MKLTFDTEAQDIEAGKVYTDGHIVFTADKTCPFGDNVTVVTTKRGKRIIAGNNVKVAKISK